MLRSRPVLSCRPRQAVIPSPSLPTHILRQVSRTQISSIVPSAVVRRGYAESLSQKLAVAKEKLPNMSSSPVENLHTADTLLRGLEQGTSPEKIRFMRSSFSFLVIGVSALLFLIYLFLRYMANEEIFDARLKAEERAFVEEIERLLQERKAMREGYLATIDQALAATSDETRQQELLQARKDIEQVFLNAEKMPLVIEHEGRRAALVPKERGPRNVNLKAIESMEMVKTEGEEKPSENRMVW